MAIVKQIEFNTSEMQRMETYSSAFPVDDSLTSGIEICQLVALKGDGTSEYGYEYNDGDGVTLIEADNTDNSKPAVGIVYESTGHYGRDEWTVEPQRFLLPFGAKNENKKINLLKEVVVNIGDDTSTTPIYNGQQVTLTGTWSVETDTDATLIVEDTTSGAATTELEAGDYVKIGGVVKQVASITDDDNIVVTEEFDADKTSLALYQDTDIEKPVYLSTNGDFQKLKPQTGVVQKVGRIVSNQQVLIELETVEY